ncbi:hypothetical protein [Miltoncostaea marina]|uniref:hypothetical protein n=1 Tax=Miltoncostaea marina TaxID=2843215 RepID=UPI001C3D41BB|nr:hypothetical protein [Miltoncostaea marina]
MPHPQPELLKPEPAGFSARKYLGERLTDVSTTPLGGRARTRLTSTSDVESATRKTRGPKATSKRTLPASRSRARTSAPSAPSGAREGVPYSERVYRIWTETAAQPLDGALRLRFSLRGEVKALGELMRVHGEQVVWASARDVVRPGGILRLTEWLARVQRRVDDASAGGASAGR